MSVPVEAMQDIEAMEPRQQMTESQIVQAVSQEIRWASDIHINDDISSNRVRAWAYFDGREPKVLDEDIEEHFQEIVSRDIADVIESTLAEILPAFASERPAQFVANGGGDQESADIESDIVNHTLMEKGLGFLELATAAKNAFLLRIGALEVYWDQSTDVSYKEAVLNDIGIAMAQSQGAEVTIIEQDEEGPQLLPGTYRVQIKQYYPKGQCKVEAVPPDELLISSDAESMDLDQARFVARQTLKTRSELVASGYDKDVIDQLTPYTTTTSQYSRTARERNTWGREKHSGHPSGDLIQTVYCYYKLDEDDDGIAELRRIVVAGTPGGWTLLEDEPTDYQPFACGAGYIWPHQPYGVSLFDKLKHVQDIHTKFARILLEAGNRAARDRVGKLPGTDEAELETSQFGGYVSMTSAQGIVPIPNPQFPAQLTTLMEMADKMRREGGGGAVDKANQEAMPVEAGAHGVERMLSAIEELNSMVARTLAETLIKTAYIKIHTVLRLYSNPIPWQVNNEWTMINPRQWRPREDVQTSTGLTVGERTKLAGVLGGIIQMQMTLIKEGSILADEDRLHSAVMAQARFMGLPNAEAYLLDPKSQEGQQRRQQQQQAQEQAQQQQRMDAAQAQQAQAQLMQSLEQIRAQGKIMDTQIKQQGDMRKTVMELVQNQEQFMRTQALQYDELRTKLVEIEAKYGEQPDQDFES